MIYTVTFNPAIDCVTHCNDLATGEVNRADAQAFYFGGKGVNVSFVLAHLGRESTALGFTAGWTGAALEAALHDAGIRADFVRLPGGDTRVNIKLKGTIAADGPNAGEVETAVNGPGPTVDDASFDAFMAKIADVGAGDFLILSGGLLPGMPVDTYARIMQRLAGSGARMVVDAEGETLTSALSFKPFLVKPNDEELAGIAGCDPDDVDALVAAARDLQAAGAQNVLVSRGGKGSFLVCETGDFLDAPVIKGELVNSVGAGDSVVAGFVEGYLRAEEAGLQGRNACAQAYKLGQACGSATAFSPWLAPAELVDQLLAQL
jgi:1-phosphofructokinase